MSTRNKEEILKAESDKQFKRDQSNAARLIIKEMALNGNLNQKGCHEMAMIKQNAALDGNHVLARFAHEIICLRRRMRDRDRTITGIERMIRLRGKPPRATDAAGVDRSVIELRRLARNRLKAEQRRAKADGN